MHCSNEFSICLYLSAIRDEKNEEMNRRIRDSQACLVPWLVFWLDTCTHGCDFKLHTCDRINSSANKIDSCSKDRRKHVEFSCCSVKSTINSGSP
jgi:hypothetical protein